jgi:regulator of protease activity HflC (stomatin/prohibitin superfamily)
MTFGADFAVGLVITCGLIPLLWLLIRITCIEVDEMELVLVTSHGKLEQTLKKPGLHFLPSRLLPWVKTQEVSLKRDFRQFKNVHVNDSRGTTLIIDLWIEFRISDAAKAVFAVAEWDRSLQNLVTHAATSILGNREFHQILCDREELSEILKRDVGSETSRWGIDVELVFVQNVTLLPEVSRQIFNTIGARLERAKADIDENGRIRIAQLDAETQVQVSELLAEAKGQYPLAVGSAYESLGKVPAVLAAYKELYELSLMRPHRMIAFRGFHGAGELRAVDAAMLIPQVGGEATKPERAP